jgi:hypothetical protein
MIPKPVLRSNYRATIIHNFLGAFVGSISGLADLHQHCATTAVRDPVSFMIVCHKAAPVLPSVVGGDSAVSLLGSAMVSVGFFGT